MRYRKTPLRRTLMTVWPANRRAIEQRASLASQLAHSVKDPSIQRALFAVKHAALAALFEAAYRNPYQPLPGRPRAYADRRIQPPHGSIFSIKGRRGLGWHLPAVHATPLIANVAIQKSTNSNPSNI
jgi:hypothetical protein